MARAEAIPEADICLILEGTYPYVPGGVAAWVHDLVTARSELTFVIVSILPDTKPREPKFEVPDNVLDIVHVYIHSMPRGKKFWFGADRICRRIEPYLVHLQRRGDVNDIIDVLKILEPIRGRAGADLLLNSAPAWRVIQRSYKELLDGSSFIDFFWTWRGLLGGMFAALLFPLPRARAYHSISTGYAGLVAARAKIETGRPALLTEHGIYSNERRIEIASATWLDAGSDTGLSIEKPKDDVRDMWLKVFVNYGKICYQAVDRITTLYEGNQILQRIDGAEEEKLQVIPNGIDYEKYSAIERDTTPRAPTVALIGRVVPIKDIKTYIRACALLRDSVPEVRALILGPTEENPEYYEECKEMVEHMKLGDTVEFAGRVDLVEYFGKIDAIVLTSISEAQPLVILEAGAAGVPTVATDVGSCRELIEGRSDEEPALGPGGIVTALSNPVETANALSELLLNEEFRSSCGRAIQERTRKYYNKTVIDDIYRNLYYQAIEAPDSTVDKPMPRIP